MQTAADPFLDQYLAACDEVRLLVERMRRNPPRNAKFASSDDPAIHHALQTRLYTEDVDCCCERATSPCPIYYIPRHALVLCADHWERCHICKCHDECDACRLPIYDNAGTVSYIFMNATIVQAVLCPSCLGRLGLVTVGA
jgi:hypothetical protein